MHGSVRVEDSPSGGARFVITLPVATTDGASEW
jgi:signal transduction histidine kinase